MSPGSPAAEHVAGREPPRLAIDAAPTPRPRSRTAEPNPLSGVAAGRAAAERVRRAPPRRARAGSRGGDDACDASVRSGAAGGAAPAPRSHTDILGYDWASIGLVTLVGPTGSGGGSAELLRQQQQQGGRTTRS
eukprot:gene22862-22304_t